MSDVPEGSLPPEPKQSTVVPLHASASQVEAAVRVLDHLLLVVDDPDMPQFSRLLSRYFAKRGRREVYSVAQQMLDAALLRQWMDGELEGFTSPDEPSVRWLVDDANRVSRALIEDGEIPDTGVEAEAPEPSRVDPGVAKAVDETMRQVWVLFDKLNGNNSDSKAVPGGPSGVSGQTAAREGGTAAGRRLPRQRSGPRVGPAPSSDPAPVRGSEKLLEWPEQAHGQQRPTMLPRSGSANADVVLAVIVLWRKAEYKMGAQWPSSADIVDAVNNSRTRRHMEPRSVGTITTAMTRMRNAGWLVVKDENEAPLRYALSPYLTGTWALMEQTVTT